MKKNEENINGRVDGFNDKEYGRLELLKSKGIAREEWDSIKEDNGESTTFVRLLTPCNNK